MNWSTILWIVIAIVAVLVVMRCCGGMRCGMPRRRNRAGNHSSDTDQAKPTKAA